LGGSEGGTQLTILTTDSAEVDGDATVGPVQDSVTVPELCHAVSQTIEALFVDEIWVRGAISGLSRSQTGHVYFDLVDPDEANGQPSAMLPVALFANAKFRVNAILKKTANAVRMEDGIEILIRGRVSFYPRQGRIQLIMSLIDPAFTLGQLEANRAKVLANLEAEGLLRANGRLSLPALPLRIGLITSQGSAAAADFMNELQLSGLPFQTTVIDARVQGDQAVASLIKALAASERLPIDVVAITRGGGARTDLAAFDSEQLARAIAGCSRPVLTGIGHETDRSIADEVAHLACKTPTACAVSLVRIVLQFQDRVDRAAAQVCALAGQLITTAGQDLGAARAQIARLATAAVERQTLRLELAADRSARDGLRCIERQANRISQAEVQVRALDPAVAMARGWSITRTADGRVLKSVDEAEPGDLLVTTVADGNLRSTVKLDD